MRNTFPSTTLAAWGLDCGPSGEPRHMQPMDSLITGDRLWPHDCPMERVAGQGPAVVARSFPRHCRAQAAARCPQRTQCWPEAQVPFYTKSYESLFAMGFWPIQRVCDIPEALIQACRPKQIHNLFKRRLSPLGVAVKPVLLSCLLTCACLFIQSSLSLFAMGLNSSTTGISAWERRATGLCKSMAKLPLESCTQGEDNLFLICSWILTSEVWWDRAGSLLPRKVNRRKCCLGNASASN